VQLREEELRSLMLRSLAGDAPSYRSLLTELGAHLRSFLRRRLRWLPEEIEDLVQELLLAIHTQRHTYDPGRPLTAWVHAIARYKLIDLLRRRARSDSLNDSLDDQEELFARADTEASEASYDVAKLLDALPDRQRLPIQYVKIDGSSVADTARRIGISESAVKIGIHRGLKVLARMMRGAA
jgi:RNA polymerase sigma-70 factor (ECF subfamily)